MPVCVVTAYLVPVYVDTAYLVTEMHKYSHLEEHKFVQVHQFLHFNCLVDCFLQYTKFYTICLVMLLLTYKDKERFHCKTKMTKVCIA